MSPDKDGPLGATEPMTAGFFANFLSHQSIYLREDAIFRALHVGSIEDKGIIDKTGYFRYPVRVRLSSVPCTDAGSGAVQRVTVECGAGSISDPAVLYRLSEKLG